MKKIMIFLLILNLIVLISCSQDSLEPGYRWELFKNTSNWPLAKAVEKEDTAKIFEISRDRKININLQEPKFGKTLLMLAVGNDKKKSTEALLKAGANVSIRDFNDEDAIHEATQYINLKKHTFEILESLIKFGSDVNSVSQKGPFRTPLQSAVDNFSCAKLLLEHHANVYFRDGEDYSIWGSMLMVDYTDKIFVARYLIIDKRMLIPSPIYGKNRLNSKPIDIFTLLSKANFTKDPQKQKAKEDILNYLKKIDFPKYGLYREVQ
jgi:uncharacterized protein